MIYLLYYMYITHYIYRSRYLESYYSICSIMFLLYDELLYMKLHKIFKIGVFKWLIDKVEQY